MRIFFRFVLAFVVAVAIIVCGMYFVECKIYEDRLPIQKQCEYMQKGEHVIIRNAAELVGRRDLVLIIHGFYDRALTPIDNLKYSLPFREDVMLVSYTEKCAGLSAAAEELAQMVDTTLANKYRTIYIVGISKGGCMTVQMSNIMKAKNIVFINMDTPYKGTILATPEAMKKKLDGIPVIGEMLWNVYKEKFAFSTVDRDIALNSEYLKNLDYSGVEKYEFVNIISSVHWTALFKDLIFFDKEAIGCYFIDKILDIQGCGIVPNESKKLLSEKEGVHTFYVYGAHNNSYKYAVPAILKEF